MEPIWAQPGPALQCQTQQCACTPGVTRSWDGMTWTIWIGGICPQLFPLAQGRGACHCKAVVMSATFALLAGGCVVPAVVMSHSLFLSQQPRGTGSGWWAHFLCKSLLYTFVINVPVPVCFFLFVFSKLLAHSLCLCSSLTRGRLIWSLIPSWF